MYRVRIEFISDPHFISDPDKIVYNGNSLEEAKKIKSFYEKKYSSCWVNIHLEKAETVIVWRKI